MKNNQNNSHIRLALTKGRLADKSLEILAKSNIISESSIAEHKSTRKLIFNNESHNISYFLSKGPDVPTYVEYGAADIGIVGKDTLLEENKNVYELMDLGIGKCRMCICGLPNSILLDNPAPITVATKYPNIARDYFHNHLHKKAELIKLNGSIELAPLVGLADCIVDIVETGSTLKENGLVVIREIEDLSARLIVNKVSYRLKHERINKIISNIRNILD